MKGLVKLGFDCASPFKFNVLPESDAEVKRCAENWSQSVLTLTVARKMDFDLIVLLIDSGCSINETYISSDTHANLLCLAVQIKNIELTKYLAPRLTQDQLDYRMKPSPFPKLKEDEVFYIGYTALMFSIAMPYIENEQ